MHALTSDGQMLVAPGLQSAPAFSATLDAVIQGTSLNSASYCISFARLELERNKREEIKLSKSDSGSVCLKLYSKACSVGMVPKVRDFAACSNSARRLVLANNACSVSSITLICCQYFASGATQKQRKSQSWVTLAGSLPSAETWEICMRRIGQPFAEWREQAA